MCLAFFFWSPQSRSVLAPLSGFSWPCLCLPSPQCCYDECGSSPPWLLCISNILSERLCFLSNTETTTSGFDLLRWIIKGTVTVRLCGVTWLLYLILRPLLAPLTILEGRSRSAVSLLGRKPVCPSTCAAASHTAVSLTAVCDADKLLPFLFLTVSSYRREGRKQTDLPSARNRELPSARRETACWGPMWRLGVEHGHAVWWQLLIYNKIKILIFPLDDDAAGQHWRV